MKQYIVCDFETQAIGPRPHEMAPKPVGLAWYDPQANTQGYFAFAHDSENTHTFLDAKAFLEQHWGKSVIVAHNAQFDLEVAQTHFDLPELSHEWFEDTLTLAFLHDPHAKSHALKELVHEWLGIIPTERDELRLWILANVEGAKRAPTKWGAHISKAPGSMVAPYAMADCTLAWRLYQWLIQRPHMIHMFESCKNFGDPVLYKPEHNCYEREKQAAVIMTRNSRQGLRVDVSGIESAITSGRQAIEDASAWLRERLKAGSEVNLDSDRQLVACIQASDAWNPLGIAWPKTASGQLAADKETLQAMITDPVLRDVLRYRGLMQTIIGTFLEPWYATAQNGGRIYCSWNMTRGEAGGARTGRMSSSPNFQNIPREPAQFTGLPPELTTPLPSPRHFLLADEGHKLISADFSAQELRIFAHFCPGPLKDKFKEDPKADMHTYAAQLMQSVCPFQITRQHAKALNFAILYGAGPGKIGLMLGISPEEAQTMLTAYKKQVAPSLEAIQAVLKIKYRSRTPIRSLGLQLIPPEPPKIVKGRMMDFSFKSLNMLIQNSGAWLTKAAILEYDRIRNPESRLYVAIHDEIVITCPEELVPSEQTKLVDIMCNIIPMEVPMLADSVVGDSLGECK